MVPRHGRTGRNFFLSMSVVWVHHYLLPTTSGLPKNIVRKEQPFVWGEEHEMFFKKHQNQIKIKSWSLGNEMHIQIATNTV